MRRLVPVILLLCLLPALAAAQQETPPQPETTPEPSAPAEAPTLFGEALPILVNARSDLELLVVAVQQNVTRPEGWNGSLNVTDPQLPLLIRLDLELLAGLRLGQATRPPGWFGIVQSTTFALARDIRHDLELLADSLLGAGVRPEGWSGGQALWRCTRATQTLVNMLERGGVFTLTADPNAPDFCQQAELEASRFTEINLLSDPTAPIFAPQAQPGLVSAVSIDTNFAVAFLDKSAALSLGTVPFGTPVVPLARSFAQFSRMMLISGENFVVFVDYIDTTLTEDEFRALPNVDELDVETFCGARWCGR